VTYNVPRRRGVPTICYCWEGPRARPCDASRTILISCVAPNAAVQKQFKLATDKAARVTRCLSEICKLLPRMLHRTKKPSSMAVLFFPKWLISLVGTQGLVPWTRYLSVSRSIKPGDATRAR
jgi:hypothetical protein